MGGSSPRLPVAAPLPLGRVLAQPPLYGVGVDVADLRPRHLGREEVSVVPPARLPEPALVGPRLAAVPQMGMQGEDRLRRRRLDRLVDLRHRVGLHPGASARRGRARASPRTPTPRTQLAPRRLQRGQQRPRPPPAASGAGGGGTPKTSARGRGAACRGPSSSPGAPSRGESSPGSQKPGSRGKAPTPRGGRRGRRVNHEGP